MTGPSTGMQRLDPRLDPQWVHAVVTSAVSVILEVTPETLHRDTRLVDDLAADSLALVEIVEVVEAELRHRVPSFTIDDADIESLLTIGDAVDYALARSV